MWLFTEVGFFSVANHKDDPSKVHIRSRVHRDLRELLKKMKIKKKIIHTIEADYPWRVTVSKKKFAETIGDLICNMDYTNFKSSIPVKEELRKRAYTEVWFTMFAFGKGVVI